LPGGCLPATVQPLTCLVTGANSGIGRETTRGLADAGHRVLMLCRDEAKATEARADVVDTTGNHDVEIVLCDLSVQDEIQQAAYEISQHADALDVLVNNAGLVLHEREITPDGHEYQFAVNHLAPFLLTHELLDPLREAGSQGRAARVVTVASEAHRSAGSVPDGFENQEDSYRGFKVYAQTKLYNILFTRALARRLDPEIVTANCLHPGVVGSNFGREGPWYVRWFMKIARPFLTQPDEAADTSLFLATSPEVEDDTGRYYIDREARDPSGKAQDEALAAELWRVSEEATGADSWPKPR